MKIFLDTADIDQIRTALRWGMIDGVTTNPSHVSKTGVSPKELYPAICSLVPGPVSLETVAPDADGMVSEGRALAKIADTVVVKVPLSKEGLIAVRRLASEGITTNVTVVFSALQGLLAAKAGAGYVSPFVGRLDAVGHSGMKVAEQIKKIYDVYGYKTRIIVAAVRNPLHVLDAALMGCDVCTMSFDILSMLYDHPLTDVVAQTFLKDWEKVPK